MFGNFGNSGSSSTPNSGSSLFNNTTNNNNKTGSGIGLFGNKPTVTKPSGVGFNTGVTQSSGMSLFGNKQTIGGNDASKPAFGIGNCSYNNNNMKSATLDDSPFGINLTPLEKVSEMPKSITGKDEGITSAPDGSFTNISSPKSKSKKKNSFSGSSSRASPQTTKIYHSNILNGIRSSKLNRHYVNVPLGNNTADILDHSIHGLFSPAKDNLMLNLTPKGNIQFSSTLSEQYSKKTFDFNTYDSNFQFNSTLGKEYQLKFSTINNKNNLPPKISQYSNLARPARNNSDIKKLVIDPDVSAAKRRKLLNGTKSLHKGKQYDVKVLDTDESNVMVSGPTKKRFFSLGIERIKSTFRDNSNRPIKMPNKSSLHEKELDEEALRMKALEDSIDFSKSPKEYWCSPPVSKLAELSLSDLSSVPNFIVGRKHYGQISFNSNVDLVDFATANPKYSTILNLYNSLFTEANIIFKENFTVEVYPDPLTKPPQGSGLNVDSIITLENVYPKKRNPEKDDFSSEEINSFVLKLKRQKETEFINYIVGSGSWSFKIQHFSIWGLIDDSDDEEDKGNNADMDKKSEAIDNQPVVEKDQVAEKNQVECKPQPKPSVAKQSVPSEQKPQSPKKSKILIPQKRVLPRSVEKPPPVSDERDKFALKKQRVTSATIPGGWDFGSSNYADVDNELDQFHVSVSIQDNKVEIGKPERTIEEMPVVADDIDELENQEEIEMEDANVMENVEEVQLVLAKMPANDDNVVERFGEIDIEDLEYMKNSLLDSEMLDEDSLEERAYEPVDISEDDLKILEVKPSRVIKKLSDKCADLSWKDTFEQCNEEDSVFNPKYQELILKEAPKLPYASFNRHIPKSLGFNELDDMMFSKINSMILSNELAIEQLRLRGKVFSKWDANNGKIFTNIQQSESSANDINVFSADKQYGNSPQNDQLLDLIFSNHFNIAKLGKRSNGYPKVLANDDLKFELLLDTFKSSFDKNARDEIELWDLASILFDDSRILKNAEFREINKITEDKVKAHLMNKSKIEILQTWLKPITNTKVKTMLKNSHGSDTEDQAFDKIFLCLCGNDIGKANDFAQSSKNFYLSVLLSLLGSNDSQVKHGAKKQLSYWISNSSTNFISKSLLKIYKLLTGDFLLNNDNINVTEGLSWQMVYSLVISFGDTNKPLPELTRCFFDNYVDRQNVPYDFELGILKVFSLLGSAQEIVNYSDFEKAILGLQCANSLDVRIQWYMYEFLKSSGISDKINIANWKEKGDKLTLSFAEQLLSTGKWNYALFVYFHLNNDEIAVKLIDELVCHNIEKFFNFKSNSKTSKIESEKLNFMIATYQLPKKLLASAIALKYHYLGDYFNEAYALLEAESWTEAHDIILNKVAPRSVIGDGDLLGNLFTLINRFPKTIEKTYDLEDWARGLGVYKNYLLLKFNEGDEDYVDSLVNNLMVHLPLMNIANPETKIALNLISKFVIKKSYDISRKKTEIKKLTDLPLCESERMYFTEGCGISKAFSVN
ncbi:nucleocytoplasmic transporter [Saccharomycopsis crataegensis]|uniref:Nucleocytoplasmic transporter n=1 Tax=Saccharomycopsis crataegensis TaxID=43959 RepID=A0AAV5QU62_9ASCO|nr:nucleocytoplasmic transporter [Saccharomycopsis crataegensis]